MRVEYFSQYDNQVEFKNIKIPTMMIKLDHSHKTNSKEIISEAKRD